jgi:hypothetical protein
LKHVRSKGGSDILKRHRAEKQIKPETEEKLKALPRGFHQLFA